MKWIIIFFIFGFGFAFGKSAGSSAELPTSFNLLVKDAAKILASTDTDLSPAYKNKKLSGADKVKLKKIEQEIKKTVLDLETFN